MSHAERCTAGEWVEVERVLLEPADRSSNLPPETAEKPLLVWVKGFARTAAALGDEVTIETMTGREVTGRLSAVNPGYTHTFGDPVPELAGVGRDLRARLAAWRADATAAPEGAAPESAAPEGAGE
jgi:hypothetical protein